MKISQLQSKPPKTQRAVFNKWSNQRHCLHHFEFNADGDHVPIPDQFCVADCRWCFACLHFQNFGWWRAGSWNARTRTSLIKNTGKNTLKVAKRINLKKYLRKMIKVPNSDRFDPVFLEFDPIWHHLTPFDPIWPHLTPFDPHLTFIWPWLTLVDRVHARQNTFYQNLPVTFSTRSSLCITPLPPSLPPCIPYMPVRVSVICTRLHSPTF